MIFFSPPGIITAGGLLAGDQVNPGARVEGLAPRYEVPMLITENPVERLQVIKGITITGVEKMIVKGKDTPGGIFSIRSIDSEEESSIAECDPHNITKLSENSADRQTFINTTFPV